MLVKKVLYRNINFIRIKYWNTFAKIQIIFEEIKKNLVKN